MKKQVTTFLVALCILLSVSCVAQDNSWKAIARGQAEQGEWVIERHKVNPEVQQVSFYNRSNILMYKEEVRSSKVNAKKDKTIKRLNELLTKVAEQWQQNKVVAGRQLVQEYFN